MSKTGSDTAENAVTVACRAMSPKAVLPDWLCPLFIERLEAAYPQRRFAPATGGEAEVELEVEMMAARRFSGQIRWGTQHGEPRAAMQSGGTLGRKSLARTLDQMIAVTPAG